MASGITNVISSTSAPTASVPGPAAPGIGPADPVHAVTPVQTGHSAGQGGNNPPPAGDPLPPHAHAPTPDSTQLAAAVEGINRFLRDSQRQMVFEIDLKSGKNTLTIVNPATGEVIRQIPAAQVLNTAANLQQAGILMPGLFLDERA